MRATDFIGEKWSEKYKRSINCNNPKGFSQRAHCQGRKKTNEAVLITDVPNEDWLQSKVDWAKEKGYDSFNSPYFGVTTAYVRQPSYIELPIEILKRIPGARQEQKNVRRSDLDAIIKIMQDTGELPQHNGRPYMPFIGVAWNGDARVLEGNHRIMAAAALGWKTLPVELKYFDGGERVESGILYPKKIGLQEPKPGSIIVMNEQDVTEGVPQPGPSSGAPKQFSPDAEIQTRQMTVKDIISSVPGVPYYNNVVDDWDAKDYSWAVTKKVIEYATYLKDHPESLAKLPPAIVLNGKFEDGAHRVSAIWLLQQRMDPKNPLWKNAKLNIQFVKQGVAENFADGKKPGRKGLAKRIGVDCSKSETELRKIAKNSSGEKQRMAHWCANMKSGKK